MTPKVAEEKLISRRKRVKTRRGPRSLGFTIIECDAVRVLAAHAHSQITIAARAGMSARDFRRACESDTKLREAFDSGIAEERLNIMSALLRTALDPKNPRQIQSAVTLLKSRHGFTDGASGSTDVSVTVNNLMLPQPLDVRRFKQIIKERSNKDSPTLIEHDAAPDMDMIREVDDPVASVKAKQREERRRS